eukprot:6492292-Amphidinium_carterae.1
MSQELRVVEVRQLAHQCHVGAAKGVALPCRHRPIGGRVLHKMAPGKRLEKHESRRHRQLAGAIHSLILAEALDCPSLPHIYLLLQGWLGGDPSAK